MGNHRLAALYRALKQPTQLHLDDETLAAIVDAELAGENIAQTFKTEMEHLESCEQCALAYSQLLLMMQEIMGDMALAADAVSPAEAYNSFLLAEIQKKSGELAQLPDLVGYLVKALTRQVTNIPVGRLPEKIPTTLIQHSPFAATLSAETIKTITAAIANNTAALSTFLIGQAATLWNKRFLASAEADNKKYCLTLNSPLPQIGEPKPTYEAGTERPFLQLTLPDSPLQLNARLSQQTPLTCRLTIQLEGARGEGVGDQKTHLHYYLIEKSAETDETGQAHFDDIPIAALPELKILILRQL